MRGAGHGMSVHQLWRALVGNEDWQPRSWGAGWPFLAVVRPVRLGRERPQGDNIASTPGLHGHGNRPVRYLSKSRKYLVTGHMTHGRSSLSRIFTKNPVLFSRHSLGNGLLRNCWLPLVYALLLPGCAASRDTVSSPATETLGRYASVAPFYRALFTARCAVPLLPPRTGDGVFDRMGTGATEDVVPTLRYVTLHM